MNAVCFVMSGAAHAPYLATALWTLRQHYWGPVIVFAWPESHDVVGKLCADTRISATCVKHEPAYRGKNSQFLDKLRCMQSLDFNAVLYLDADVLVYEDPTALLSQFREYSNLEFIATQFNDWHSNQGQPQNRVRHLIDRHPISQPAVHAALTTAYPSPNGGVFAARPGSDILKLWETWTAAVLDLFIADETCLHAIVAQFYGQPSFKVELGGAWNCSPKYQPLSLPHDEVAILHGHGDCWTRPDKSPRGANHWAAAFRTVLDLNIGGIRGWWRDCGNKHLNAIASNFS